MRRLLGHFMNRRFSTLVLLLGLATGAAACNKLEARDSLNKGVRAFKSQDFEGAAKLFKTATELDPNLTVAEIYLATAYFKQFEKDPSEKAAADSAIETFEKIIKRNPADPDAVAGIAAVYQKMGRHDKAREYYMKQTELKADDPTGYYAVASLDWSMAANKDEPLPEDRQAELIEEGLKYADKALTLNPDHEGSMDYKNLLYREKARLADAQGKLDEAAAYNKQADEWFDKAVETRKKNGEKSKQSGIIIEKK
jgi:tetratricopeptide (TPR) repeat protein